MRIAGLVQDSIVDGPGLRFTVFIQGCDIGCVGCHNPEAIDKNAGTEMSVEEIISEMLSNPLTDGLTLSGGEPFTQASDCARLAAAARENNLSVWTYSGRSYEELLAKAEADPDTSSLMNLTDVLVDGRFVLQERTLSMKWRGSKNQRFIDVPKSLSAGAAVELKL
ncbi:MAG: anaerobic ribonucleoside-triphosphate reductase activating protein [Oscillospiraceae bacterium]|nr:anaerobic ribonucleoside-triphosphate reductase activating protein [Oscillospiraceae bacterium]